MRMLTLDIEAYNAIKPASVMSYLIQQGWSKRETFSDKAEIWTKTMGETGKVFEVLLPISTDIPDYASRMDDVFRVLEILEQRPKLDIFNDLVDVSAIAADTGREILNLHFRFLTGSVIIREDEASIKNLGTILESLQTLFDSLGQAKAGQLGSFGKIAKEITDRTRLSMLGTIKGSFGIRLALAPQEKPTQQLELLPTESDESLGELVIQEFLNLLEQSCQRNFNDLSDRLIRLQRRSTSNYRKFLGALADANANLAVNWGSTKSGLSRAAWLRATDAVNAIEVIQKIEVEAPQEYQIVGELLAASKSNKTFEIRNLDDDRPFSGKMVDEVITSKDVELTIGNLYTATLREQIIAQPITGQGKIERLLIKIHPWYVE